MPTLAMFEVAFRNSVHRALSEETRSEYWFPHVLHPQMYENTHDLIQRLERRHGNQPTAGKILSEITFGFWPRLFAKSYNSLWWRFPDPLIGRVLPYHSAIGRDTRAKLQERLEYFATLRNRAMHHEALYSGVAALNRSVLPVEIIHGQLMETLGWIHPDAALFTSSIDRFERVLQDGKREIRDNLQLQFHM